MGLLFFYLFLALGVSFLCSLFEAVILSVTPAFAEQAGQSGKSSGKLLLKLKNNIEDSLAAILTLNTIAHTIGAAGVGAQVLKLYGDGYVAIGSIILTLLVLVLSEIIPKTLGATFWRPLSLIVAPGIQLFILLSYPFVYCFKRLAKVLSHSGEPTATVTREELVFNAELGKKEGQLDEKETRIIRNLLRLRNIRAQDIMTPRTVVFALDETLTCEEVIRQYQPLRFSRIPIYSGSIDNTTGFVMRFEILRHFSNHEGQKRLKELKKPLHAVPPSASVGLLLDQFIDLREHIFLVIDEHGGVAGIITLEDAIEAVLGVEIVDELDSVDDMRMLAKEQWEARRKQRHPNT